MERDSMITFISGGARSGKSSFAEAFTLSVFQEKKLEIKHATLYYVATAMRSDKEMEKRIAYHIKDRSLLWKTVEVPFELASIFGDFSKGDVVLLDCLTIWLSNMLFEKSRQPLHILEEIRHLMACVKQKEIDLFLVSNDVNEGIPTSNNLVVTYTQTLEILHREIIQHADKAIQVIAGIPVYRKGEAN
jgi:adenosylcobinamide kinase/adenosylcobinamide-phosphate guanylyltransferase